MRKIKEVLRLKYEGGLSNRAIARACSMGRATVAEYLERAGKAGVSWPVEVEEEKLESMLFSSKGFEKVRVEPDWSQINREFKGKGVTLSLLWQEYKGNHPEGYGYTQFCEHYRRWLGGIDPVMRQSHKAGEKLFVDYAGQTVCITDPVSGQIRQAQVFVAVLGASSYTYAELTWTQGLNDWLMSHVRAFEFLGGVPEIVVPDNLKSAVSSPCRYEPELNPAYSELAAHYGVSVIPARVRKPRDKAKVENGVLQVERWVLAPLRNRTFFELGEANGAVRERVGELNGKPFQGYPDSRVGIFEKIDRPALRALPCGRYEYAEWKKATVAADYHVEVDGHYYSVPYRLMRQKVDLRISRQTVECYCKGVRVASHVREDKRGESTTIRDHMPPSHRSYLDWTPDRIMASAEGIGVDVVCAIKLLLGKRHVGIRSCLGVLHLAKEYGGERLCAACKRAMAIDAISYKSIQSILKTGLDQVPLPDPVGQGPVVHHENVRGSHYYN